MERELQRDLEILTTIDEGRALTQRAMAQRLGVALGLTNLLLKRLAKKGYIKIVDFPRKPAARKRLRYLLTARGIAEKTRLTYEHAAYSLNLYRRARQTLRDALRHLPRNGVKRIALYGSGEAAELAYLTLKELGVEPFGALVLATFERPDPDIAALARLGIPADKILGLRRAAQSEASA